MQNASHCLATDLDGTFVGDSEGLQALLEHHEQLPGTVSLIYITGRHLASTIELIETENLPLPDVLATDIGTAIHTKADGGIWTPDSEWEREMTENWLPERILQVADTFPDLQKQDLPDKRRVSFYTDSSELVQQFERALLDAKLSHRLIYSSGRDLDILPEKSGKAAALEYIIRKFEIDHNKLLVAGDSGNDFDMLNLGYPSVVVGNGLDDLIHLQERSTLYRAKARCAGGILEAWKHFYPDEQKKQVPASK